MPSRRRDASAAPSPRYREALQDLYRARLGEFVAVRTRLAAGLRTAGDGAGAAALAKCRRPTLSAWAVNQLWWRSRDAFDAMTAAAEGVRGGQPDATRVYRDALARLRQGAGAILRGDGHAAGDDVLRRVGATLSALAVAGFAPDEPGTLVSDRAAPGFEGAGVAGTVARPGSPAHAQQKPAPPARGTASEQMASAAAARARRAAERQEAQRRRAEEVRRRRAERALAGRIRVATAVVSRCARDVAARRAAVSAAEAALDAARRALADLERERP